METLELLATRIETTGEIQSIVRTMKSLSAVSIRQYERAVEALHRYEQTIEHGLQAVLRQGAGRTGIGPAHDGRTAALVFGSDRGLCGRFNEAISEFADRRLDRLVPGSRARPLVLVVGGRAAARLDAAGRPPDAVLDLPGSVSGLVRTAQAVLIQFDAWRASEGVTRLRVYFNRRTEEARAQPTARQIAPLSAAYLEDLATRPWPSRGLPLFTMAEQDLFSWLLRQHLFVSIYRAGAESLASEHASRLTAMQAAERNIEEQLDELAGAYRRKRQDAITAELLDIVSGFEAMR